MATDFTIKAGVVVDDSAVEKLFDRLQKNGYEIPIKTEKAKKKIEDLGSDIKDIGETSLKLDTRKATKDLEAVKSLIVSAVKDIGSDIPAIKNIIDQLNIAQKQIVSMAKDVNNIKTNVVFDFKKEDVDALLNLVRNVETPVITPKFEFDKNDEDKLIKKIDKINDYVIGLGKTPTSNVANKNINGLIEEFDKLSASGVVASGNINEAMNQMFTNLNNPKNKERINSLFSPEDFNFDINKFVNPINQAFDKLTQNESSMLKPLEGVTSTAKEATSAVNELKAALDELNKTKDPTSQITNNLSTKEKTHRIEQYGIGDGRTLEQAQAAKIALEEHAQALQKVNDLYQKNANILDTNKNDFTAKQIGQLINLETNITHAQNGLIGLNTQIESLSNKPFIQTDAQVLDNVVQSSQKGVIEIDREREAIDKLSGSLRKIPTRSPNIQDSLPNFLKTDGLKQILSDAVLEINKVMPDFAQQIAETIKLVMAKDLSQLNKFLSPQALAGAIPKENTLGIAVGEKAQQYYENKISSGKSMDEISNHIKEIIIHEFGHIQFADNKLNEHIKNIVLDKISNIADNPYFSGADLVKSQKYMSTKPDLYAEKPNELMAYSFQDYIINGEKANATSLVLLQEAARVYTSISEDVKKTLLEQNIDIDEIINSAKKKTELTPNATFIEKPLEGVAPAAKEAATAINEVKEAQRELFDSEQLKAYDLDLLNLKPELRKQEMNDIKDYARQMYKDIKDLGDESTGYEDDHIWGIKKSGEYVNISDAIKEGTINAKELEKLLTNISYLYQTGGWNTVDTQIGEHPQYTERNDPLFESRLQYMQQYDQLVQALHKEESALRIEEKMSDEERLQRQQEILQFEKLINDPELLTQKIIREKEITEEIEKRQSLLKSMQSPLENETDVYKNVDWETKPREENLKLIAEDDIRRQQEQLVYLEQRKQIEQELIGLGQEYNALELPKVDFSAYTGFSEGLQKIEEDVTFAQQRIVSLTDDIGRYNTALQKSTQNTNLDQKPEEIKAGTDAINDNTKAIERNIQAQQDSVNVPSPTVPENKGFEQTNALTEEHIALMEEAARAELEKLEVSKKLSSALLDETGAFKAVGVAAENAEKKKSSSGGRKSTTSTDTSSITNPSGLELSIGVPEDEKARIIAWFEEVKNMAENIQSISISPKFEVEDNEKTLVGYVATVKQINDETKIVESSVVNLNAELSDADGSWNRLAETVKSATSVAKEFNAEFQKELATQQIDTLKSKLGELPFDFKKVEDAASNIVDKKSLEAFNNVLTLTKEKIKTAQAEVKNENSLSAFTAMEKNLERIPTRIEVLEERVKRFASVEGFDKVSGEISNLYNILEKVNTGKANEDIDETTKAYDELTSAISRVKEQMLLLGARKQSGNTSPISNENTLQAQALFDLLKNADEKFKTVAGKTSEAKVKVDELIASFRELNKEALDPKLVSNFEDLAKKLSVKFDFGLSDDGLKSNKDSIQKQTDEIKSAYRDVIESGKEIKNTKWYPDDADKATNALKVLKTSYDEIESSLTGAQKDVFKGLFGDAEGSIGKASDNAKDLARNYENLINRFEYFKRNASAAVHDSNFGPIITQFETNLRSAASAADATSFKPLENELKGIELGAKAAGLSALTMGDMIERGFKKLGSYMINRVIFSSIQNALSTIYQNVIDLDFAMKDLERISGATGQKLSQAFEKSGDMAIRLGSSIKDVLGSVGEYSRLGLGIEESLQMAESTALLASSGVMSLDKATEGLISTTRANLCPYVQKCA